MLPEGFVGFIVGDPVFIHVGKQGRLASIFQDGRDIIIVAR